MMMIMRALLLATTITALAGCVVDRDRDFDRHGGYNDFRSSVPHGLDHLDRPD